MAASGAPAGAAPSRASSCPPSRGAARPSTRSAPEDESTVVGTGRTVTTPAGRFRHCVKTRDFSPLDKANEHKYYCRGVGLVREDVEGGNGLLVRYER